MIETLIAVAERPRLPDEATGPRNADSGTVAARLLGKMRAVEAVPVLLVRLGPTVAMMNENWPSMVDHHTAAGNALIGIGMPAADPLIAYLAEKEVSGRPDEEDSDGNISWSPGGDEAASVLWEILGPREAIARLQDALATETSDAARRNLSRALTLLEKRAAAWPPKHQSTP
jgi:hypothetical protein